MRDVENSVGGESQPKGPIAIQDSVLIPTCPPITGEHRPLATETVHSWANRIGVREFLRTYRLVGRAAVGEFWESQGVVAIPRAALVIEKWRALWDMMQFYKARFRAWANTGIEKCGSGRRLLQAGGGAMVRSRVPRLAAQNSTPG